MTLTPATNKQLPDHAILDMNGKQNYLGNQFIYTFDGTTGSTSEFPIIYLLNPGGLLTSFPSGYKGLFCGYLKTSCLTTSQSVVLKAYLNPTISSNGTPQTPINLRSASSNTSISNLYTDPTASSNGTLITVLSSTPGLSDLSTVLSILDPGKSLLITATTSSSSTVLSAELCWNEI